LEREVAGDGRTIFSRLITTLSENTAGRGDFFSEMNLRVWGRHSSYGVWEKSNDVKFSFKLSWSQSLNRFCLAYVPYHTHSVTSEGRDCNDCHLNPAVIRIQKGEKVPVVDFKNGQLMTWKGVVPVIDGKLDWVFLNRTGKGWEPVPADEKPSVQFAAFGSPLTTEQFEKLTENVLDDGKK
jgi:hypothetical protein